MTVTESVLLLLICLWRCCRVMVGQFEQHEEGFFMLPPYLPTAKCELPPAAARSDCAGGAWRSRGSREAFRVETFVSGDAICVQATLPLLRNIFLPTT